MLVRQQEFQWNAKRNVIHKLLDRFLNQLEKPVCHKWVKL